MAMTWVRGDAVATTPLRLRPLRADDGDRLCDLFWRLSPESRLRRFLAPMPAPRDDILERLLDVDHWDREAIAALDGDHIVGVARYARRPGARDAEVAVTIADDWQRHGLGRLLMRRLVRLARRRGIAVFTGTISGENRAALLLVRSVEPDMRARWATGEIEFEMPLAQHAPAAAAGLDAEGAEPVQG
jgi:acetyltransferase